MVEVRVNFPLDDNEVERIFNTLGLRYDTKRAMIFGKYHDNELCVMKLWQEKLSASIFRLSAVSAV